MENLTDRNSPVACSDDRSPATTPAVLDSHGFDPADFEWRPVPRRPRSDGWTPEVQQRFIEALARTGIVERACQEVGLSVRSAYNLRNAAGGEGFARAWKAVLGRAADRLLDVAFEQAIEGEEVPIFDQDGVRTGSKRRYNTRMAMFLLRAYHPERFRHANRDDRAANEQLPPPAQPLAAITAPLAPETPADPALLIAPVRRDAILAAAGALAIAQRHPADDSEPYRFPEREDQHPKVAERARMRRARRARLDEAATARNGLAAGPADGADDDAEYGSYEDDFEF